MSPPSTTELSALAALVARARAPILSQTEVNQRLATLPGWEYADDALIRTFQFADYYKVMAFVNALAFIAHRQNHHPDLSVHYDHVKVSFSTHDVGGVTLNDCICAAKVEMLSF